jgi:hypothetical protein
MDNFSRFFQKDNIPEIILLVILIIYIVLDRDVPEFLANIIDSVSGKIVLLALLVYLFIYSNPILFVVALFAVFSLVRKSSLKSGITEKDMPSEEKKSAQFTAYNQFPYTLELEIVKKMAPIVKPGASLTPPSYKPLLDDIHEATAINSAN